MYVCMDKTRARVRARCERNNNWRAPASACTRVCKSERSAVRDRPNGSWKILTTAAAAGAARRSLLYMRECMCVCVCVDVQKSKRERERESTLKFFRFAVGRYIYVGHVCERREEGFWSKEG